MKFGFKKLITASIIAAGIAASPALTKAEIQCPQGWVKKVENSVVVCVAQDQNQNQTQTQNNNQNQNVNQNVVATGGNSSSSSSSSNNVNIVVDKPKVVSQAPATVTTLPKTGLPEAAMAVSALVPAGFALKKFGFKKSETKEESAASIWLSKNS